MTDPRDPALTWSADGAPRSGRFGDVYFSAEDGLAETRAVFLAGCGLPGAWRGRRRFTVGELGFGTGLNIAALLDLWRREGPPDGRLQIFSIEAFPLTRSEAERALAAWPELADITAALTALWPPRTPGFHRIELPQFRAVIDLAVMEAAEALNAWTGAADAWFLDGFAPSANPEMWRDAVLDGVAARCAPGAAAATFTVAGVVRRALEARGFTIEKRPGHGRKRERLEARLPGVRVEAPPPARVAVVGGGVAGAALVRALRAQGCEPVLVERTAPGAGASGNAAALVTPRLDAGGGPVAALFAQALERAAGLYREAQVIGSVGVVQLEHQDRDASRFDRIAAQDLWAPGAVERVDRARASALLGEEAPRGGMVLAEALVVRPRALLDLWLEGVEVLTAEVVRLEHDDGTWRLIGPAGDVILEAEAVILATGAGLGALWPALPLGLVRGQASFAEGAVLDGAVAWGGYAVPAPGGVMFGATHDRHQDTTEARAEDDRRNLDSLARVLPALAGRLGSARVSGRAGLRAVLPDRLPVAGSLADGLYVLGGLGSRGFATAPLLSEHVAALALSAASPLPASLARLVEPGRFQPRTEPTT